MGRAAVVAVGAVVIAACSAGRDEVVSQSTDEALITCNSAQVRVCTGDPDLGQRLTCTCQGKNLEADSCALDTRVIPAGSWLAQAECGAGRVVWPSSKSEPGPYQGLTLWTCMNQNALASLPQYPKIFGDAQVPQDAGIPCPAAEWVAIMFPGASNLPACGTTGQLYGECSLGSLNSSCYPDPPLSTEFVVAEWYDMTACGGIAGGCNGTACRACPGACNTN
jgi:hypothetical protein